MFDSGLFFANSASSMTTKTRNRLIALFILMFPFMVLFGFLLSQDTAPSPTKSPALNPDNVTNTVYPPR
jgi:hypothetical protein